MEERGTGDEAARSASEAGSGEGAQSPAAAETRRDLPAGSAADETERSYDLRTRQWLGEESFQKIRQAKVAVLGLGGVGGMAAEALVRSGVRELLICDCDRIEASNFNRQLIATRKDLGRSKVEAWSERLQSIRPDLRLHPLERRLSQENLPELDLRDFDVVLDCLDTVSVKIGLAVQAREQGYKLLSSGGMAKRSRPEMLIFGDIYETTHDPMFRVMRRELRRAGSPPLEVLYSREEMRRPEEEPQDRPSDDPKALPSMIFVPGSAGLRLAQRALQIILES